MSSQLALDGFDPAEAAALTERQAQALAIIRQRSPIRSEDLGGELRELRGGRPTGAEFDASNGKAVAEALHAKGLVAYVRREGWVLAENAPGRKASSQLTEIPEWF